MPNACDAQTTDLADFREVRGAKKRGKNTLSKADRDGLIVQYLAWFRKMARDHARQVAGSGGSVEVEELEGEAFLAATEAAQYFDPKNGAKFSTFATPWVRSRLLTFTDPRTAIGAGSVEFPDRLAGREDGPEEFEEREPNEVEARMLGGLDEPTRTIVRLFAIGDLSPDRIAVQLGMAVKDVRLHLRNAAPRMRAAEDSGRLIDYLIAISGG